MASHHTPSYESAARLFKEAVVLPQAARGEYILRAALGDEALARRVRLMISYVEQSAPTADLLSGADADQPEWRANDRLIGAEIGRFRIVSVIGEGGFGVVYRAEQEHPVRRTVAVKILKASAIAGGGMDSRQVVARFEAERQALAMMEHPGIARVIDAGQTDPAQGSRPYFVMELVCGEPITAYCDRLQLDLEARLGLFTTACQAVQHAHQRGIIHRDLKPSNVLVTDVDGLAVAKIIDFGIAKAIQQPLTASALVTNRLELLGTPQYMSPEQADAGERAIDTRADVYSLGVILYELLTGTTPLDGQTLRRATYSRMLQMIIEQRIERPSARLIRVRDAVQPRNSDVRSWARQVRRELDWITMKALDAERARRYESPAALADDIGRYLHHDPVQAGPPTAAYRLQKFVRRHRLGVAAAAMVVMTMIGGAIIATIGMVRAQQSDLEAMQVNQFMRDVLTSANPDNCGADVRLVDVLDDASRTASQRFAGHPIQEAAVRSMLGQVYTQLNFGEQATAERRRAVELLRSRVDADDPRLLEAHLRHASALLNQEFNHQASKVLDGVVPVCRATLRPDDPLAMEAQRMAAFIDLNLGRSDEAEKAMRDLLRRVESGRGDDAFHIKVIDLLIYCLWTRIDLDEAESRKVCAEIERLAQDMAARSTRVFGAESIMTLRASGIRANMLWRRGENHAAAEIGRDVLALSHDRLTPCHTLRIQAMSVLAEALHGLGDAASAADLQMQLIECGRGQPHPVSLLSAIGDALPFFDHAGRFAEGESHAREYAGMLRGLGGGHDDMLLLADLYLARFISGQGRVDEAQPLFDAMVSRARDALYDNTRSRFHVYYARHLTKRGLYEQAERELHAAAAFAVERSANIRTLGSNDLRPEFIALYHGWGKPDKAAEYGGSPDEAGTKTRTSPRAEHEPADR